MKMSPPLSLLIEPEGDSCLIIRLQVTQDSPLYSAEPINTALNQLAIQLAHAIQLASQPVSELRTPESLLANGLPPVIIEAIPSFDTVGVYYDLDRWPSAASNLAGAAPAQVLTEALHRFVIRQLQALGLNSRSNTSTPEQLSNQDSKTIEIPICYDLEYGIDLPELSQTMGLSIEQIIELHTRQTLRVFMLGFSPGLPFHGLFDPAFNLPRRSQPRTQLVAGSVGIANRQGVIYPFATPGGWHIVGRTPMRLFNPAQAPYTPYQAGDMIQFRAISKAQFLQMQAEYEHSR